MKRTLGKLKYRWIHNIEIDLEKYVSKIQTGLKSFKRSLDVGICCDCDESLGFMKAFNF
jgi:hypothetical protein